jgi:hypothetical protein
VSLGAEIAAVLVLIGLAALATYALGWELMVFGVAAAIAVFGGWFVWAGVALGAGWAVVLGVRRWRSVRQRG